MKKIIHFKIPMEGNRISIPPELVGKFMTLMKDAIGSEYIIIASPFDPSSSLDGVFFYNFDMEQLDVEQLVEMVEELKRSNNG